MQVPPTDVYETDDALTLIMEMPGVDRKDVDVALENDVLRVEGRFDFSKYQDMEPVYTEYNVGHYIRDRSHCPTEWIENASLHNLRMVC